MAEDSGAPDVLLQARISDELYKRMCAQRERWGMSNREFLERVLADALPRWEGASGPPMPAPQR